MGNSPMGNPQFLQVHHQDGGLDRRTWTRRM